MTRRLLTLGLALAFALAQVPPAPAQTRARALDDWSAVQNLSPGQKIIVRTKDGDRLTGRFDSANDLLINLTDDGKKLSLTRESVRLVQLNRGKSRWNGGLLGAAIGGGGGAAIGGALVAQGDDYASATFPGTIGVGALIGFGIGAAIGKGRKNETIYESKQ